MNLLLLYFLLAMNTAREVPAGDAIKGPTCEVICVWGSPCQPCGERRIPYGPHSGPRGRAR